MPPPLPLNSIYTSCYCEENIYLLCQAFLQDSAVMEEWEVFVLFISNSNKTVALWCQKAARSAEGVIVWDYHVILVIRPRRHDHDTTANPHRELHSWVYDFDTRLALPCPWKTYLSRTFPECILPEYESRFRVIEGESFLQNFASDRTHMLLHLSGSNEAEPAYLSPIPVYPPICGASALRRGVTNNLMECYVATEETTGVDSDSYGVVLDMDEIDAFFSN